MKINNIYYCIVWDKIVILRDIRLKLFYLQVNDDGEIWYLDEDRADLLVGLKDE